MSQAHKIILVGFSSFERVTFESFFRLAARRPPGYVLVEDAAQAHLAVVNADDTAVLRQVIANKPAPQVLLIGSQDGGTGWMLQRRPLNLMKVLATVESLLTPQTATVPADLVPLRAAPSQMPAAAIRPATPSPAAIKPMAAALGKPAAQTPTALTSLQPVAPPTPVSDALAPKASPASEKSPAELRRTVRTGMGARREFDNSRGNDNFTGLSTVSVSSSESAMDVDHILVVDDSDIALKFMRNRLSRFGFHADLVNSGEEALGKMNTRPYKFVFLDVMMEGLDGYQTCRAIKQRKYSDGKPPVVVMLTSRGGTIDKIRGTLAGCDAYLTKPLNERDLIAVLAKHDRSVARGFQETNFGSNSASGFSRSVK
jgi:two-component system, cell cycle response regulator